MVGIALISGAIINLVVILLLIIVIYFIFNIRFLTSGFKEAWNYILLGFIFVVLGILLLAKEGLEEEIGEISS